MGIRHSKVSSIPDGADTNVVRPSDWNAEHTVTDIAVTELKLIPKASSTGAEGTIFYNSGDDHVYVGVE